MTPRNFAPGVTFSWWSRGSSHMAPEELQLPQESEWMGPEVGRICKHEDWRLHGGS